MPRKLTLWERFKKTPEYKKDMQDMKQDMKKDIQKLVSAIMVNSNGVVAERLANFFLRLYWDNCDNCSFGTPVFWSERHKSFHHNNHGTKKRPSGGPCSASLERIAVRDTFGKAPAFLSVNEPELSDDEDDDVPVGDANET